MKLSTYSEKFVGKSETMAALQHGLLAAVKCCEVLGSRAPARRQTRHERGGRFKASCSGLAKLHVLTRSRIPPPSCLLFTQQQHPTLSNMAYFAPYHQERQTLMQAAARLDGLAQHELLEANARRFEDDPPPYQYSSVCLIGEDSVYQSLIRTSLRNFEQHSYDICHLAVEQLNN